MASFDDAWTLLPLPISSDTSFINPYTFSDILSKIEELYSLNGWSIEFSESALSSINSNLGTFGNYDYLFISSHIGTNFGGRSPFTIIGFEGIVSSTSASIQPNRSIYIITSGTASTSNNKLTVSSVYSVSTMDRVSKYYFGYGSIINMEGSTIDGVNPHKLYISSYNDMYSTEIPITYVPVNSILNGPAQANIGDAVEVDVSFPDGYKLKDAAQGSGISVYNDNGYIDFTYDEATRKLRFTMPE